MIVSPFVLQVVAVALCFVFDCLATAMLCVSFSAMPLHINSTLRFAVAVRSHASRFLRRSLSCNAYPLRFFVMPCRRAALHFIVMPPRRVLRYAIAMRFNTSLCRCSASLNFAVACQCYPLPQQCNVKLCRCFAVRFTSVLCRCSAALSQFCCLCPCDCLLHHSKPLLCFAMR